MRLLEGSAFPHLPFPSCRAPCLVPHAAEPLLPWEPMLDTLCRAGPLLLQSRDAGSGVKVLGWNSSRRALRTGADGAGVCRGELRKSALAWGLWQYGHFSWVAIPI